MTAPLSHAAFARLLARFGDPAEALVRTGAYASVEEVVEEALGVFFAADDGWDDRIAERVRQWEEGDRATYSAQETLAFLAEARSARQPG